jgi:ferrous iron transport protein B
VILGVSLVLWALTHLPLHDGKPPEISNSVVAQFGHTIEPAIRPLGFDCKIGVGLETSIAAREVIISTLGTLNGIDPESHALSLQEALHSQLTIGGAAALLIFFAFAMQCTSTLAVVRRETNSWKWPAIQFTYMTVLAYVGALVTNVAITRMFG